MNCDLWNAQRFCNYSGDKNRALLFVTYQIPHLFEPKIVVYLDQWIGDLTWFSITNIKKRRKMWIGAIPKCYYNNDSRLQKGMTIAGFSLTNKRLYEPVIIVHSKFHYFKLSHLFIKCKFCYDKINTFIHWWISPMVSISKNNGSWMSKILLIIKTLMWASTAKAIYA